VLDASSGVVTICPVKRWALQLLVYLLPLFVGFLGLPLGGVVGVGQDANVEVCELSAEVQNAQRERRRDSLTPPAVGAWLPRTRHSVTPETVTARSPWLDCRLTPLRC
jgi:hypothetical protein